MEDNAYMNKEDVKNNKDNLKIKNMKKEGREGGREEEKEERKKKQKKDSKLREDLTMKKQDKEIILGWG